MANDITPPQISEERIVQLWIANSEPFLPAQVVAFTSAVIAERDRQWLERLEPVGYRIDWPDEPDLGFQFEEDPVPAHLGRSERIYRIKEQG